ncbi:MAG: DUF2800 domain-containing protein [Actinomycetes bacterium]
MSAHAQLSPSSAVRWMSCPGSVRMCEGIPDTSSAASLEGTMMHTVSAHCLTRRTDAAGYVGVTDPETGLILQAEQAQAIQTYVDTVRDIVVATGGALFVEQRLSIWHMTGEEDAHGTADAVILTMDELIVIDAKFGRGVAVEAEENPQLMMYAAAAYVEHELAYDFKRVRMMIVQPRLNASPEWTIPVAELNEFMEEVQVSAELTRQPDAPLMPSANEAGIGLFRADGTARPELDSFRSFARFAARISPHLSSEPEPEEAAVVVPVSRLGPGGDHVADATRRAVRLLEGELRIPARLVAEVEADSPLTRHVRLDNVLFPGARVLRFVGQPETPIRDPLDQPLLARLRRPTGDAVVLTCSLESGDLPLRIAFPATLAPRLMPGLFPERPA